MTGIDVTAVAIAKTSTSAGRLWAVPRNDSRGSTGVSAIARKNGSVVPTPTSHAVGRRFSWPSTLRTLTPDTNISSSRPRLYRKPRTTVGGVLLAATEELGGDVRRQEPQQGRAQHDARQDLADHLGLAQPGGDLPEQVRPGDEEQQRKRQ